MKILGQLLGGALTVIFLIVGFLLAMLPIYIVLSILKGISG